jgi:hypothetical protein
MNPQGTSRTVLLAICGLVIAGALGAMASSITSRPVGISAEAVSVGDELVARDRPPRRGRRGAVAQRKRRKNDPASTKTAPRSATSTAGPAAPAPAPAAPGPAATQAGEEGSSEGVSGGGAGGSGSQGNSGGGAEYEPPEHEDDREDEDD